MYQVSDITPSSNYNTISLTLFDGNITGNYLPIAFATYLPGNALGTNRGIAAPNLSIVMRYD
jgi:hypothetical protein